MLDRFAVVCLLLNALTGAPAQAADCGADVACRVEGGEYRIALPDGPPRGALIFFHGHNGSAEAQMRSAELIAAATARGLAFVAPDGMAGSWAHAGSPSKRRDEAAYTAALIADLDRRFAIPERALVVSGFSQGASMAFDVVCREGRRLAAMVTFAGVFWEPMRAAGDCAAPPPVIHFHGRNDPVFPLSGRAIGNRARQGDTYRSIALLREAGGCGTGPATAATVAGVGCAIAEGCAAGGPVGLCLHDGGHDVRAAWLDAALTRLGF